MKKSIITIFILCFLCIGFSTKSYASNNNEIYSVVLPTIKEVDLVIDPQGIHGVIENNDSFENLDLYAGKISCSDVAMVTNLSSAPVKVRVSLKVTGDATAVSTREAVENQGHNILLYAAPSATDTKGMEDNYKVSSTGIVLSEEENVVEFILPQATYRIVQNEDGSTRKELLNEESGHGMALSFGGYVNKEADWSAYTGTSPAKKIGMTAVFSFTDVIEEGEVAGTQAYGMKEYAGKTIEVENGYDYIPPETDIDVVLETYSVSDNSISVSENTIPGNEVPEENTVSGNEVVEEDAVSENEVLEENTIFGNEVPEENTVSENEIVRDITDFENEVLRDITVSGNEVAEENMVSENEISVASTVSRNEIEGIISVSENNAELF